MSDAKGTLFNFGQVSEIYRESIIIRKTADFMAIALNSGYNRNQLMKSGDDYIKWHELDWLSQESKRAQIDFIPIMLNLAKFSHLQLEAIKNHDVNQSINSNILEDMGIDTALAQTLAHTEHLRWNAFHVVMGYKPMSIDEMNKRYLRYADNQNRLTLCRKDTSLRLHLCLVQWIDLDECYAAYKILNPSYKNFKELDYDGVFINISKYLRIISNNVK